MLINDGVKYERAASESEAGLESVVEQCPRQGCTHGTERLLREAIL